MVGVVSGKIIDFIIMEGGYGYSQTPITKIPLICKTSWSSNTSSSGSSGSSGGWGINISRCFNKHPHLSSNCKILLQGIKMWVI